MTDTSPDPLSTQARESELEPLIDVFIRILGEHGYGILRQSDLDALNDELHTYRQRAEEAEEVAGAPRAENDRLREALERVAATACADVAPGSIPGKGCGAAIFARAALSGKGET